MSQCPISALLPMAPLAFRYLLIMVLSYGVIKHILMKVQNVAHWSYGAHFLFVQ